MPRSSGLIGKQVRKILDFPARGSTKSRARIPRPAGGEKGAETHNSWAAGAGPALMIGAAREQLKTDGLREPSGGSGGRY